MVVSTRQHPTFRPGLLLALFCVAAPLFFSGCATGPKKPSVDLERRSESKYGELREAAPAVSASDAEHIPPVPHSPEAETAAKAAFPAYFKGIQLMKQEKWPEALKIFETVSKQYPVLSGPYVNIGIIQLQLEDLDAAEKALQKAIDTNPQNPYAWNLMGRILRDKGKFDEARQCYEKALSLDYKYAKAHYNLAVLAELYLRDLSLALQHFQVYQQLQKQPDKTVSNWIVDLERRGAKLPSQDTSEPQAQVAKGES